MIINSLNGVVATGAGTVWYNQNDDEMDYGVAQVSGITVATVQVQGRLTDNHSWEDIYEWTADGIQRVSLLPQMRMYCSVWTSGTIYGDMYG